VDKSTARSRRFVVRPGQTICAELATNGLPVALNVIANGYLTKDR